MAAGSTTYDVEFVSANEGKTAGQYAYATLTSRSFHTGGVNALLLDGSVRFVPNGIPVATWRALGSRMGAESLGNDF